MKMEMETRDEIGRTDRNNDQPDSVKLSFSKRTPLRLTLHLKGFIGI
jgi:hypothetical protein